MPTPDLLKPLLVCPRCKGPLEFRDEAEEILCRACALIYPVREGIPVMLVEEAVRLPGDGRER